MLDPHGSMAWPLSADVNEALMKGDFNLMKELVESGADVNRWDREGRTPLMNCCLHDGEGWVLGAAQLLLSFGARVGDWDRHRCNALIHTVQKGLVGLCLGALDCDLNHTDQAGCTALWHAAAIGHVGITTMIILSLKRYGLEINKANKDGLTPLMQAHRQGHTVCANMLRDTGTSPEQGRVQVRAKMAKGWEAQATTSRSTGCSAQYLFPCKPLPKSLWENRRKLRRSPEPIKPCGETRDTGGKGNPIRTGKQNPTAGTVRHPPTQKAVQPQATPRGETVKAGQSLGSHGKTGDRIWKSSQSSFKPSSRQLFAGKPPPCRPRTLAIPKVQAAQLSWRPCC
ncbi:hemogen isoform X1 [Chrysemys picta bellii]|uniref:hemogen isoform X1 n=1 Tax=Chrysemys picta bellii TaxID=8478 RepID=UPI001C670607|nr:hemogen isoform X1 [Chrysemys picta bellii]XP_042700695.1 hemogen isoform X1 [Chrysemys picta bellii]XP_042700696.1 hemogen isoform X1 [Chrysemys picta bellii]